MYNIDIDFTLPEFLKKNHNLDFYIDLSKDNIPGYDMIIGIWINSA